MITEWDTKQTYIERIRARNKARERVGKFRAWRYKRGMVWTRKPNAVLEYRRLMIFLKTDPNK